MMNDNYYRSSGCAIAIRRIAESLTHTGYCVAGSGDRSPEDLSWVPSGKYGEFRLKTSNPLQLVLELRRFRAWFRQQKCDLVHCHHRRLAALLELAGLPVVYTHHLAFPRSLWFRCVHPKQMTAVTPSVAENLLRNTGKKVVAVIGNPAAFPQQPPAVDIDAVRRRAVCIARLEPVKGHTYLLSAWKLLRERAGDYYLDLVGEGPLRAELEKQAKRDRIADLVTFHGYSGNVAGIIESALFATLVSEKEGQGIVTLEAAARGRASLLTSVPGSIDLLPPKRRLKNGIAYRDVHGLADALQQWFADPQPVVEEGRLFFDFLKASSDTDVISRQYEQVYRLVSASRRSRSNRL